MEVYAMSKFDELCRTYVQSKRAFTDYQNACRNFARDLIVGMVQYFDWPQNQEITYIPLGEAITPNNRFYALAGAMRMDDQSFWHFGVELTIYEYSGANPVKFVLSFFVKKVGTHFIIKLGPNGKEIRVHEAEVDKLEPLYDAVFVQIKEFFSRRYFQIINSNEPREPGFIALVGAGSGP
jgi:hypothetical protein